MAITWPTKREVVNAETELSKVVATRTDDVAGTTHSFFVKGRMKSPEEQKKVWDNIWAQWLAVKTKIEAVDTVAAATKVDLEAREVA